MEKILDQKFQKLLTIEPKIQEIQGSVKSNGIEIPGKKFGENLGTLCVVVFFSRDSGKCCSICHWKLPEMQTRIFGGEESAQGLFTQKATKMVSTS